VKQRKRLGRTLKCAVAKCHAKAEVQHKKGDKHPSLQADFVKSNAASPLWHIFAI